jgi:hypothetical protein
VKLQRMLGLEGAQQATSVEVQPVSAASEPTTGGTSLSSAASEQTTPLKIRGES